MLRRLLRASSRTTHRLSAAPLAQLEPAGAGRWRSLGDSPVFELRSHRGTLPCGWVELRLALDPVVRGLVPPLLRIDSGSGFSDAETVRLPMPRDGRVTVMLRLPGRVLGLRLEPLAAPGEFTMAELTAAELGAPEAAARLAVPVIKRRLAEPWDVPRAAGKLLRALRHGGPALVLEHLWQKAQREDRFGRYGEWHARYDTLGETERKALAARGQALRARPHFSIVMPVYDAKAEWLEAAIASVRAQLYPHWELCIADDASKAPHVRPLLERAAAEDPRIRVVFRPENGHIAAASNSALHLATGDYLVLLDHDDELREHALLLFAEELDAHPEAELLYSDEDKLDEHGRLFEPHFKPDFNLDLFLSYNYLAHACALKTSRVREVGGFRPGSEGSQDYDLYLRLLAAAGRERVRHVPRVLYHWRAIEGSTALSAKAKTYAEGAALEALQRHLDQQSPGARVERGHLPTTYRVHWPLPAEPPLVTLIIPTRDQPALLRTCVESILARTAYRPFELLLVDNQSEDAQALRYLRELQDRGVARVLRYDRPFNFSAINNAAVREARGSVLGLLNNDLEIIDASWLSELVSHALRPTVGAAGARLLYPDRTVQHAGVIVGIGGVAGHGQKHLPEESPGYFSRAQLTQELSAVTAACLVIRKSVYQQVGGFDEELAIAFNDVDFCLRVREAGFRNIWTPYATLVHYESKSRGSENTRKKQARFRGEVERMLSRWGAALTADPAYNPNLTLDAENFTLAFPPRVPPLSAGDITKLSLQ